MQKQAGIIVVGLSALLLLGAGCSQQASQVVPQTDEVTQNQPQVDTTPIKIGWLGPLTGDVSTVGIADKQAAEIAAKEINDAGGINGRLLEVIYEDGFCDAKTASNAGNKLINIDKVVAIIGGFCSGETLAVAPTAEQNKIVMFSPGSTSPTITTAGDYIFRLVPSDSFQGKYAANFVYNTLGKRRAAILNATTDYAQGLALVFGDEFKKLGGEVVITDSFQQTDRDLKTQLTKIKNSSADVIYFPTYTEAGVAAFKQARQLGLAITIMGPETMSDPKITAAEGTDGILYTVPVSSESETFKTKFLTATSRTDMPVYASQTYDAVKLLATTIAKVGVDGEKIKNELYAVKGYQGASGDVTLDSNGDLASANYEVMVIKNNKAEKYQAQ